jgi:DNA ligase (NAD+)
MRTTAGDQRLLGHGLQLQDQGELGAEFAASTTLGGLLDKLNIPSVGPGGAQKLADKFGSLEAVIAADWLDMRQALPEKQAKAVREFFATRTTPIAGPSSNSC